MCHAWSETRVPLNGSTNFAKYSVPEVYDFFCWCLKEALGYEFDQIMFSNIGSLSKGQPKLQHGISNERQDNKSSVFRGRSFRFSSFFPDVQVSFSFFTL